MTVSSSVILGRFLFLALLIVQGFFLASYPAQYEGKPAWYAITLFFIPAVLMWWFINSIDEDREEGKFSYVTSFWVVYSWLGLVPVVAIVFSRIDGDVLNKAFWDPSTLKLTLSITPLLLIITFQTKIASSEFTDFRRVRNRTKCCTKSVINICDGIELVCVVSDKTECSLGIPQPYKNTLIAFACITILFLPFVLRMEYIEESRQWRILFYPLQAIFETIFLGLRIGLTLAYGVTVSIFIMKNIVMIAVLSYQILNLWCGLEDEHSSSNAQQSATRPASHPTQTPAPPPLQPPIRVGTFSPTNRVQPLIPSSSVISVVPTAPPPYNTEMVQE